MDAVKLDCCTQVFMHYPFQRDIQPTVRKTPFETRNFGEPPCDLLGPKECRATGVIRAAKALYCPPCNAFRRFAILDGRLLSLTQIPTHTGSRMTVEELMAYQTRIERFVARISWLTLLMPDAEQALASSRHLRTLEDTYASCYAIANC